MKPIELVQIGDWVVSRNDVTGHTEPHRVAWTKIRQTDRVLNLTLAEVATGKAVESITTTEEHPFFVQGIGWVPAGRLAIGNVIVTRAGPDKASGLVVKALDYRTQPLGWSVYNFEVEQTHSYFVGTAHGGTWVHNYPPGADRIVLGNHPDYINTAREIGAGYMDIPDAIREGMSLSEQWFANVRFLERAINRGAEIILATPAKAMERLSFYRAEIDYLIRRGFSISEDGTRMLPPGG